MFGKPSDLRPPSSDPRPPLIVVVGPTAVGKTATAIALAEIAQGEIVSADSRYLYRGMDIGTAKPSPEEQARVLHYLIDVTTPDRPWTLSQYQLAAVQAIGAIHARGRLPLLVGGTGQYIRAVIENWQIPPGDPSRGLRLELEADLAREGVTALAKRLREADPASAGKVDLRNPRRVIRALEVALATGESFVAQRRKGTSAYETTLVGLTLPRRELYARIDARVDAMLNRGLVDEVRRLAAHGYGWELPAMSALGYRQVGQYLRGECALDEAARHIKRATRQLVRRQANWFKPSDPAIRWFDMSRAGVDEIAACLQPRRESGRIAPIE